VSAGTESSPLIVVVVSETKVRERLIADLARRFGSDYELVGQPSGEGALASLAAGRPGREVAVVIALQRLSDMTGVQFLGRASALAPAAKRGLVITYGDPEANQSVIEATTFGLIEQWCWQPWEPAEELLFPFVSALLTAWSRGRDVPRFEAVRIVGEQWSAPSHELRDLLQRNGFPYGFYTPDSERGRELLADAAQDGSRLPVALFFDGRVLIEPSRAEVAAALGVTIRPQQTTWDLAVVGAGPAGLAAALYGASEGLRTVLLEGEAIGGQAGTSTMIRNYLGFPRGISGGELTRSAAQQARQLGATFVYAQVAGLKLGGSDHTLVLRDQTEVTAKAVVLAIGVSYRRLGVPAVEDLVGAGVFYGVAATEAQALRGQPVFVVGAANSAGQAALHLAGYASQVTIVVRGSSLREKMSDYLVRDIERAPNTHVRLNTEVVAAAGTGRLQQLTLRCAADDTEEQVDAAGLFVLIGAIPRTAWLPSELEQDSEGFILTGADVLDPDGTPPASWPLSRPPLFYESSVPGVFAAGDVRYRSTKRVAAAVGEGSVTVRLIHEYLSELSATAR
jgi:thioredoxin reductase (NADPH)